MRIEILFFDGCPNHRPTTEMVRNVVESLGLDVSIREVEVRDVEQAVQLKFFGSPTVRVNGKDIDPAVWSREDYSFSCRRYGRSGSPPRTLVEEALLGGTSGKAR